VHNAAFRSFRNLNLREINMKTEEKDDSGIYGTVLFVVLGVGVVLLLLKAVIGF